MATELQALRKELKNTETLLEIERDSFAFFQEIGFDCNSKEKILSLKRKITEYKQRIAELEKKS